MKVSSDNAQSPFRSARSAAWMECVAGCVGETGIVAISEAVWVAVGVWFSAGVGFGEEAAVVWLGDGNATDTSGDSKRPQAATAEIIPSIRCRRSLSMNDLEDTI